MKDAMPIRVTKTWMPTPQVAPVTVIRAGRQPNAKAWATVSMTDGPGSRIMMVVAAKKAR